MLAGRRGDDAGAAYDAKELCKGNITLQEARDSLTNDWRIAYRK